MFKIINLFRWNESTRTKSARAEFKFARAFPSTDRPGQRYVSINASMNWEQQNREIRQCPQVHLWLNLCREDDSCWGPLREEGTWVRGTLDGHTPPSPSLVNIEDRCLEQEAAGPLCELSDAGDSVAYIAVLWSRKRDVKSFCVSSGESPGILSRGDQRGPLSSTGLLIVHERSPIYLR